ncbi:unnamed protein product [Chironomus riparius]|uniref:Helicase ARIP4 n=1 Tax=Chironomus riparius TaxID=315576 RepID=A0A9N9S2K3_9DIPT|nr:unnamed protein product [Chironomus riparius]
MSSSSPSELEIEHTDNEDPLIHDCEDKIRDFKEVEIEDKFNSVKRKLVSDVHAAKKPKIKEEIENHYSDCEKENHNSPIIEEITREDSKVKEEAQNNEDDENETGNEIEMTEKENKLDEDETDNKNEAISKEKKDKKENEKKFQNLRKNIKDVLDESQLDATTLAAQRQESERLARLQEAQRVVRETQRQIAAEKHANKTQQKVLSLLGDQSNEQNNSTIDLDDPLFEKLSLNPAISITPACKETLQSIQSLISTDDKIPDSDDDDVIIQPQEPIEKSKAVIVDSSSDSDDCIILSDEEEEDEDEDDENNSGEHTNDVYNKHDAEGRVIINIGHNENEPDVFVAPQIAKVIKPHQVGGVRFLYDNIIESIELFEKSTGFGCILAHSMGLGKTLQLVCFCDIFLRHTNSKTVLVIMPINTLQNWNNEFNMWIPSPEDVDKCPLNGECEIRPRNFKIHVLNDSHKSLAMRSKVVLEWKKEGGVLMMGYEMFRLLSLKKVKQKRKKGGINNLENDVTSTEDQDMFDKIYDALVNPGADLIVCDEGHRIKNASASTSLALKQVKTKRRVVLTGYPLQNNLLEYWCMVDFVRPSYLGTKTEFSNMFERPIQNGQCIDSTPQDCKLMRYRAHVLHSLLKGFVQRRSHSVLQKCLPDKTEHILLIRLTPFQRKLYTVFMDEVVRSKKVPNPLKAFAVCCKIWNHPDVLYNFLKKRELDLEIELEENDADRKNEPASNIKKRGRKSKDKDKDKMKQEEQINLSIVKKNDSEEINPIRLEVSKNIPQTASDTFKPPVTPSSNDSAYSSNQSLSSNYEGPNTYNSYSNYQNYDVNNYQNYNYPNGNFSNWNNTNSNSYWQNNYYQPDNFYHPPNSYQPYYGNQQITDTKPLQCNNTTKQEKDNIKVEPSQNLPVDKNPKPILDGGLLADVIQKEAKEQQEKNNTNKEDIADTIVLKNSSRDDGIPYDWAVDLMKDYVPDLIENSPKLEIFLCILNESIKLGDRLLVFSQSLLTLNLLEKFLQRLKIPNSEKCWAKNQSYFRLDGSTAALERERLINEFNSNIDYKLFMVSTRAGSLGINLVGANRVVVFDASWNPCHDTQAICRVYRYGQTKPCYVYRLVVDNCLEKKIYDRQINKQGMADRVIDECNPDAHLSIKEVTSLCYDDGDDPEIKDFTSQCENHHDFVMKKILIDYPKALTKEPFQHESLLIDRKEKKLSQAEKRLAQRGYEMEKQAANKTSFNYNTVGNNYRLFRTPDGTLIQRPVISNTHIPPIPTPNIQNPNQNPAIRAENPRPNRWVPVEVWQSKGIIAQEMTLPQDVSIQTNSADKSKIFLKAGQKIIVLKSPRGICLQLESGKVIAIRASMKTGQPNVPCDLKNSGIPGILEANDAGELQNRKTIVNSDDVIDMTNSDDDDDSNVKSSIKSDFKENQFDSKGVENESNIEILKEDIVFKEKPVYKPNLVHRKPKIMPPPTPVNTTSVTSVVTTSPASQSNQSNIDSQSSSFDTNDYHKWNRFNNKSSTNYSNQAYQDLERTSKSNDHQTSFTNPYNSSNSVTVKSESNDENPTSDPLVANNSSAFHAPPFPNTFMQPPSQYSTHNAYPPYQNNSSNGSNNYNYPSSNYNYYQQPFSNSPRPYLPPHNNYDPQYSFGYNQYPSTQMLPSSYSNTVPTTTATTTMTPSSSNTNYSRWDWNK